MTYWSDAQMKGLKSVIAEENANVHVKEYQNV